MSRARGEAAEPSFRIGSVPVYGDLILAPMSGFSDWPYRSLCRELGSALSYTEFISARAILHGPNPRTRRMLFFQQRERPVVVQIFDSDPDCLVEAARRIEPLGPDIIDINMGCSVRHVSGRGAGAGLLKTPHKISRIISSLVRAVAVPVTAKIRLGWDEQNRNYLEVGRRLEGSGASLIAVHGRTRSQAYRGEADWGACAELVRSVRIPVIANGDVRSVSDCRRLKEETGCAGVMVGRGAIGHPWIFQRRDRTEISFREKGAFLRRHLRRMIQFYGQDLALLLVRKHVARYLKGYRGITLLQKRLVQVASVDEFQQLLEAVEEALEPRGG